MVTGLERVKQRRCGCQTRREQQCAGAPLELRHHLFGNEIGGVLVAAVGNAGGTQLVVLIPGVGGRHLNARHDAAIDGLQVVHCLSKQCLGAEVVVAAHGLSWLDMASTHFAMDPCIGISHDHTLAGPTGGPSAC